MTRPISNLAAALCVTLAALSTTASTRPQVETTLALGDTEVAEAMAATDRVDATAYASVDASPETAFVVDAARECDLRAGIDTDCRFI